MNSDLSSIAPVEAAPGKYQWVKCKVTGIDDKQAERTHTVGQPFQMPGVIIFVHGVNSEGEWYFDAASEFSKGLNRRLGRDDLERFIKDEKGDEDKVTAHRYLKSDKYGKRVVSPIIPFWWGYKAPDSARKIVKGTNQFGSTPAWTDEYGNPLRADGAWGGGPFQNGGGPLPTFWLPTGFRQNVAGGTLNVNAINPVVGRTLCDCPPRLYYAHAARRLANLVKDIRQHLPAEPINIVSHSQGTMVALCALFYLDQDNVRPPDTVILNSSPYRCEPIRTDKISASDGADSVSTEDERVTTLATAVGIMAKAAQKYVPPKQSFAACTVEHRPRHGYDDALYGHMPTDVSQWEAEIGGKVANPDTGRGSDPVPWWSLPKFRCKDTRGKLVVNFNPADRLIGVEAVAGMGWRGITPKHLAEINAKVKAQPGADAETHVWQRLFARGTNPEHNPPVGSYQRTIDFFYAEGWQPVQTTGEGGESNYRRKQWYYLDGSPLEQNHGWTQPSEKILHVYAILGDLSPNWNGPSPNVQINAPLVPRPLSLPQKFDGGYRMYSGQEGKDPNGNAVKADKEQQEDFEDDVNYQERRTVMDKDEKGLPVLRYETWKEVELRRLRETGNVPIPPTNHAAILRFKDLDDGTSPVADVLSYDLTVGQGYAWHDPEYWAYLLDLADWKKSDPYYQSGHLPESDKAIPPGIAGVANIGKFKPRPPSRTQREADPALGAAGGQ